MKEPQPSSNYYDNMLGSHYEEMAQIKQFSEMAGIRISKEWQAMQDLTMQNKIDLQWLHDLYKAVIIPEVQFFGLTKRTTAQQSKFVEHIDLNHEQFSDVHEILRLGYVHLYHRFEAYRTKLIKAVDLAHGSTGKAGIVAIANSYYGIDIDQGGMGIPTIQEVAYVANSMKHTEGRPLTDRAIPPRFKGLNPDKKMILLGPALLEDMNRMQTVSMDFFLVLVKIHALSKKHMKFKDAIAQDALPEIQQALKSSMDEQNNVTTFDVKLVFSALPSSVRNKWPPKLT
jgi:hypothetical protein